MIKEMTDGKISPKEAVGSVVLSKELPRNDNFARLYKRTDTKPDMIFRLKDEEFHCH